MITETEIKKLNKEIDVAIEKYYCVECLTVHKRIFRGKLNKTFVLHFKYRIYLTEAQKFKIAFKKSWRNYIYDKEVK